MTASVPLIRAGNAAAHRRVDRGDAAFGKAGGDRLGDARAGGRESTKTRTRDPAATPRSPRVTSCTTAGMGRLAMTISAREATSVGEDAVSAPFTVMALSAWPWMS